MSRQELAEAINTHLWDTRQRVTALDGRYVGKLERGEHRWPQADYRQALRTILHAPTDAALGFYATRNEPHGLNHFSVQAGQEYALHEDAGYGSGDHRRGDDLIARASELVIGGVVSDLSPQRVVEFMPMVAPQPAARIGEPDVTRIEATTGMFRDWDNRWGGGLPRAAVIAQLGWVAASAKHATCGSTATKQRLLTALADLAGLAAFLCYDVTLHEQARTLWLLGLGAAREAGNIDLASATLRQLAHQNLHLDRPDEALRLLRLAYATTVDPAHHTCELALAEIAAYEGWCYAAAGKQRPCQRALGRAEDHFANADGEQPPPWLAHLDAAELAALRGHTYHVLANTIPQAAQHAITPLRQAIAARPDGYARSRTLNLIALSATYFQQGTDLDEGVAVGGQALDGVASLNSPRTVDRLRYLIRVTDQHLNHRQVPEFRERLTHALTNA